MALGIAGFYWRLPNQESSKPVLGMVKDKVSLKTVIQDVSFDFDRFLQYSMALNYTILWISVQKLLNFHEVFLRVFHCTLMGYVDCVMSWILLDFLINDGGGGHFTLDCSYFLADERDKPLLLWIWWTRERCYNSILKVFKNEVVKLKIIVRGLSSCDDARGDSACICSTWRLEVDSVQPGKAQVI